MRFKWCRAVNQSSGPIRQITRLCYVRVLLQLEADDSRTNQDHAMLLVCSLGPAPSTCVWLVPEAMEPGLQG